MRKSKFLTTSLAVATLMSTLAGCSTTLGSAYSSIIPRVAADKAQAKDFLSKPALNSNTGPVSYTDKSWLAVKRVFRNEKDSANVKTDAFQIEINRSFKNLTELVGSISSITGLPVFVESDVTAQPAGANVGQAPQSMMPGDPGMAMAMTLPPLPGSPMGLPGGIRPGFMPPASSVAPSGAITASGPFSTNYSGSLTGLMNLVAAHYGISWKAEEAGIRFYKMETKTFRISALPGDVRLSSSVEATSNSAGEGGKGTQGGTSSNSTGVSFASLSVWSSLETAIKQMLSANGKVFSSPATGTITVKDTPSTMASVTEFISSQNMAMSRQVSVNVRVLSVEVNEGDDYGINWDSVYRNLTAIGNPYSIALKTAFPMANGGGNLVLSSPVTSTSRWAGSSAMIAALSTQGRVSELTSSTLMTLNNQPSPVNVGRKVSYLASSSTTQTPNVGATTSLTPGTVQTGFSMTLLPHIIDGKELLLQYSLDLSSLLKLTTINSGSNSIQAPDIATSNFIQRVRMLSGETLVVAGFDQDNLSAVASGIGAAENPVLGGRNATKKRSMLVVLIQPTISSQ